MLAPQFTIARERTELSASVPVRVQDIDVSAPVRPHDHAFYEICLIRGGRALHETPAGRQPVGAGDVIVMAPGDVHAFPQVRGLRVTNVYYLSEWLLGELSALWREGLVQMFLARHLFGAPVAPGPLVFRLPPRERALCLRELADIQRETAGGAPSWLLLRAALIKCLTRLSRAGAGHQPETWIADARVQTLLTGVEETITRGEHLRMEVLAAGMPITPDHAARLLRAAIGLSPRAYFQRRRAQRASLLLLDPALKVTQVAHRLGYTDNAHLTRCFREHLGVSPREYRRAYLKMG